MYLVLKISTTTFLFSLTDLYLHEFTWSYHKVIHFNFIIQYSHSRYQCLDRFYQIVYAFHSSYSPILEVYFFWRLSFLLQFTLNLIFTHIEPSSFLFWQQRVPWLIEFNCWVEIMQLAFILHEYVFLLVLPITWERMWQKM